MPSHLPAGVQKRLAQRLRGTLRTARLGAALTQAQMAERVGLAPSTYGRLERGTMAPGPLTLRLLCQTLCLTLEALVGTECAAALRRASRPARRRRPARLAVSRPRAVSPRASPFASTLYPLVAAEPWALLATPSLPAPDLLTLLLMRRRAPLAFVVDMG